MFASIPLQKWCPSWNGLPQPHLRLLKTLRDCLITAWCNPVETLCCVSSKWTQVVEHSCLPLLALLPHDHNEPLRGSACFCPYGPSVFLEIASVIRSRASSFFLRAHTVLFCESNYRLVETDTTISSLGFSCLCSLWKYVEVSVGYITSLLPTWPCSHVVVVLLLATHATFLWFILARHLPVAEWVICLFLNG